METKVTECATLSTELESTLFHPHGEEFLPHLIDEVRRGVAQLWKFTHGDKFLYVITRLETYPTRNEWVITWARGNAGRFAAEMLKEVARKKGWYLRIHVDEARARLFRRYGFVCDEYVMRFSP